ncbi:transposase [Streptomyces sp. 061-3]|uniref:transposase n=1 Tax=Streptomyces sp. 061-3 TaxID=2789268 RepID=UPI0039806585
MAGPNQVDRGKKGSKLHVLSEAQGLPLVVAVSGANLHDSQAFKPLILGIPAVRSRRGPRRRRPVKIRADKAYYSAEHLCWLRGRNLVPRIARPGIESGRRIDRFAAMSRAWGPPPRSGRAPERVTSGVAIGTDVERYGFTTGMDMPNACWQTPDSEMHPSGAQPQRLMRDRT